MEQFLFDHPAAMLVRPLTQRHQYALKIANFPAKYPNVVLRAKKLA
jgi:hypothetical protein